MRPFQPIGADNDEAGSPAMVIHGAPSFDSSHILSRLTSLATLDKASVAQLERALEHQSRVRPRTMLAREGVDMAGPRLIVAGWAARTHIMRDGSRQILGFLLPGDLVGQARHAWPIAPCNIEALTEVVVCDVPKERAPSKLGALYDLITAFDQAYLLQGMVRMRLNALDRLCDLMLELYERVGATLPVADGRFHFPLNQEVVGAALGLTSVHVSRMLKLARRNGDFDWRGGLITLPDPAMLAARLGRPATRVSATSSGSTVKANGTAPA